MILEDSMRMKGEFHLEKIDVNTNEVVQRIDDYNLIVNTSFDIIYGLLVNADENKKISKIVLGNGGIYQSQILTPHVNDNELQNQLVEKSLKKATTQTITSKKIVFHFDILPDEGNGLGGNIFNEAGLMSKDNTLFARKTFENTTKTRDFLVRIEWALQWIV